MKGRVVWLKGGAFTLYDESGSRRRSSLRKLFCTSHVRQKIAVPGFRTLYCTVLVTDRPLDGEVTIFWAYEKMSTGLSSVRNPPVST